MAQRNKSQKKKQLHGVFWRAVHGQLLTTEFFSRHWLKILVGVVMVLVYISNKYQCQTRMVTIDKLKRELEIVKNQCITERSLYMGRTRESAMQELIDTLHLNLRKQEQPPFKISYIDEND